MAGRRERRKENCLQVIWLYTQGLPNYFTSQLLGFSICSVGFLGTRSIQKINCISTIGKNQWAKNACKRYTFIIFTSVYKG